MYPRKQNHICLILSVNGDQAGIPGDMTECFSASSGFRLRSYLPHRENPDLSQQLKSSLSVPLCVLLFVTVFSYLTLIIIRKFSFVKRILTTCEKVSWPPVKTQKKRPSAGALSSSLYILNFFFYRRQRLRNEAATGISDLISILSVTRGAGTPEQLLFCGKSSAICCGGNGTIKHWRALKNLTLP